MKRHVVSAADDAYVQHYAVMLASFIDSNDRRDYTFHLLTSGLSRDSHARLHDFTEKEGIDLRIVDLEPLLPLLHSLPVWGHITTAAYFRLLIPAALPAEAQTAIYLDCDLLVLKNLRALADLDLCGHAVAAVTDFMQEDYWQDLGLARQEDYFNSGVLVINLNYWRSHDVTGQALAYVRQHPNSIHYHDQCALNAVLAGRVHYLPEEWNAKWTHAPTCAVSSGDADAIEQCPVILHFAGPLKPWAYVCDRADKALYWKYLERTPWRNYIPVDRTLANRLKRIFPSRVRLMARKTAMRFK
jgi:lipopolysaccharide biosynthesis glycosyltransferase